MKSIERPGKVNLWGRTFTVEWSKLQREGDDWGRVEPSKGLVTVSEKLSPIDQRRTLIHEIVHHTMWDLGQMKWDDESTVGMIEFALWGVIRENPDLIRWLLEVT